MKNYLNFTLEDKDLITLLKLQTDNHQLAACIGCFRGKRIYEERLCNLCTLKKVETIFHVIIQWIIQVYSFSR